MPERREWALDALVHESKRALHLDNARSVAQAQPEVPSFERDRVPQLEQPCGASRWHQPFGRECSGLTMSIHIPCEIEAPLDRRADDGLDGDPAHDRTRLRRFAGAIPATVPKTAARTNITVQLFRYCG